MKNKIQLSPKKTKDFQIEEDKNYWPDYPVYPPDEDIYSKFIEEDELNPEYPSEIKESNVKRGKLSERDFDEDKSGSDLDIPGSELDDELENIGSEDEENNYYSLGGDNHDDLDEYKGD